MIINFSDLKLALGLQFLHSFFFLDVSDQLLHFAHVNVLLAWAHGEIWLVWWSSCWMLWVGAAQLGLASLLAKDDARGADGTEKL